MSGRTTKRQPGWSLARGTPRPFLEGALNAKHEEITEIVGKHEFAALVRFWKGATMMRGAEASRPWRAPPHL
jgi:hypothetical protein